MSLYRTLASFLLIYLLAGTSFSAAPPSLESGFQSPPRTARPIGWWHWINGNVTKEGILADLENMKAVGMGGAQILDVEVYMPPGPVRYGTDNWHDHIQYAIQQAARLGLELQIMNAPGWSASGGPWVTPALSMKQLVCSETGVQGGRVSTTLAKPDTKPAYRPRRHLELEFYRDVAVIAVPRTMERLDDIKQKINWASKPVSFSPSGESAAIPLEQVIDLTSEMDEEGRLVANLPKGDWEILRFGMITTGKSNHPAVPEGTGLEIDKLDADAVAFQFEQALGRIIKEAGEHAGTTLNGVLFDSFEGGFQNWSESFPAEFVERKGYDFLPYLPLITGRIIGSREQSEAVLWDFRQVIEELLTENYFGTMQRLAHRHGLKIYSESQGGPLNPMANNRSVDVPMNEFWMPDVSSRAARIKQSVSAASFQGRPVVAAEAFTATPENGRYKNTPATLKGPGDHAFTLGINRFAFHSYTHQPVTEAAPGFSLGRYGTHFGRLNTWWPYADGWIEYLSRSQFLLQQGRISADVCILLDENIGYGVPSRVATLVPGYDIEFCYPPSLREMKLEKGKLVHPAGGKFRILMTPDKLIAANWVSEISTLRHIRDLLHAGAVLAGNPPTAPAGLTDLKHADEFNQIVNEIWGDLDSRANAPRKVGKGRVYAGRTLLQILEAEEIAPDFSASPANKKLRFIHRTTPEADIYFVANGTQKPIRTELSFRQTNRVPEIWDPLSGSRFDVPAFTTDGNSTRVPYEFAPWESTFVVFRRPLPDSRGKGNNSTGAVKVVAVNKSNRKSENRVLDPLPAGKTLKGPWQVHFKDGRGAPNMAVFEQLACWSAHTNEGIRHYSGTAVYSTKFGGRQVGKNQSVFLDLGEVADIARVFVNGKDVGVLWTPPLRVDISPYLSNGENSLEIHVANRWINRIIGDESIEENISYQRVGRNKFTDGRLLALPDWLYRPELMPRRKRHSFSIWKHYDARDPLVRSGLLGPVKLVWFHVGPGGMLIDEPEKNQQMQLSQKSEALPKKELFHLDGNTAVVYAASKPANGKPWIWFAPTLKNGVSLYQRNYYRDAFFKAGISIAGFDLGEVRGAPASTAKFHEFYKEMVRRGYSAKPILLGQSRGGVMLLSWAVDHPENVGAFVGIYPVLNLASWPLKRSEEATLADYRLTKEELVGRLQEFNPIDKLSGLVKHEVPLFIVHGDSDKAVPYKENSGLLKERYENCKGRIEVKLIEGEGHRVCPTFFECPELVDFIKAQIEPH